KRAYEIGQGLEFRRVLFRSLHSVPRDGPAWSRAGRCARRRRRGPGGSRPLPARGTAARGTECSGSPRRGTPRAGRGRPGRGGGESGRGAGRGGRERGGGGRG